MFFFYKDPSPTANRQSGGFNPDLYNANKQYKLHYYNMLVLSWISSHTDDFAEKTRAEIEIEMCRKKIKFAENFHNFDKEQASRDADEIKKMFNSGNQRR